MTRISKREAFKRFVRGEKIILCPVKLRPGFPFSPEYRLFPESIAEHKLDAAYYAPKSGESYYDATVANSLWKGDIDKTAWDLMYNNWAHYNTSYEAGYYAAYYVES